MQEERSAPDARGGLDVGSGRALLWHWIEESLVICPTPILDREGLRVLCAESLDTYAPALLVRAYAAGFGPEYLIAALLVQAYHDRYGPPRRGYATRLLQRIAHVMTPGMSHSQL